MPNKRDLKLDDYGISRRRYQELKAFCLQYDEWRDELKYNVSTVKSKNITDMPICHTGESVVENQAIKREPFHDKCEMVEQTLIQAIGDISAKSRDKKILDNIEMVIEVLYPRMLKGIVNDHIDFAYLDEVMNIPCGRNTYYKIRRYFFFLLSEKRN